MIFDILIGVNQPPIWQQMLVAYFLTVGIGTCIYLIFGYKVLQFLSMLIVINTLWWINIRWFNVAPLAILEILVTNLVLIAYPIIQLRFLDPEESDKS